MEEPPAEALTALGRLTWYAILLDDYASAMCWQVKPGLWDLEGHDPSISTKITRALAVLKTKEAQCFQDAAEWLRECKSALEMIRNGVFHSVPLVMRDAPDAQGYDGLGIMPRSDRTYVEVALTPDALNPLTAAMQSLVSEWVGITHALAEEIGPYK